MAETTEAQELLRDSLDYLHWSCRYGGRMFHEMAQALERARQATEEFEQAWIRAQGGPRLRNLCAHYDTCFCAVRRCKWFARQLVRAVKRALRLERDAAREGSDRA